MIYYKEYGGHEPKIEGKKKKFDNNIYTFDIETTSYISLYGKVIPACEYLTLSEEDRKKGCYMSCMYIWSFSINDTVYYGRTWDELADFWYHINDCVSERKIIFVHNLAFEFQFFKSVFVFTDVMARKSRKPMKCFIEDYNMEFRCTYMMSNCSLKFLAEVYGLPIKKLVGDLDYTKIRTPATTLYDDELRYCEYDCLLIYYYILCELETYPNVDKIPITSTGHVRRELKELVDRDYNYKNKVRKAINTDPHIYNLLQQAFMGGYTHANWIYTDEIMEDVDSWDFTSSYPYVLVSYKYPSTEFRSCRISKAEEMLDKFAYLVVVRFKGVKSNYDNNFISASKCRNMYNVVYDNGRVMTADQLEMTLTDVDFKLILKAYSIDEYEILESYFSFYDYLPKQFIEFCLDKYVSKTKYKDVEGKEVTYIKEKNKFNSLYGMSVTNTIRDNVVYDDVKGWEEIPLTNEEIETALYDDKKKSFLSFAYGVWVTAHARNNLLQCVMMLDEHTIYCDTDSLKLIPGYDKKVITDYNKAVKKRLQTVSDKLDIPFERFAPKDSKGIIRMLGVFDDDGHYERFITQGAKKYCVEQFNKKGELELKITVAGVPKAGAKCLKSIDEFRDDFIFTPNITNKNGLVYNDEQKPMTITDYQGNTYTVADKSGCCLIPATYILGKSYDYDVLLSSRRATYKE